MQGRTRIGALAGALLIMVASGCSGGRDEQATRAPATRPRPVEEKLKALAEESDREAPPEVIEAGRRGLEELRASGILETALDVGARAPSFTLSDAHGAQVSSEEILARGPMVLVFYRGAWCPFCNLYLRALQEYLPQLEAHGATLVAVSGESPDGSLTVEQENALKFTVLSDPQFAAARRFGIVYEMPKVVNDAILKLGFDLAKYYGTETAELPLSATYVIDRDGTIRYAFLDPDYHRRAEPSDILEALEKLPRPAR